MPFHIHRRYCSDRHMDSWRCMLQCCIDCMSLCILASEKWHFTPHVPHTLSQNAWHIEKPKRFSMHHLAISQQHFLHARLSKFVHYIIIILNIFWLNQKWMRCVIVRAMVVVIPTLRMRINEAIQWHNHILHIINTYCYYHYSCSRQNDKTFMISVEGKIECKWHAH